MTKTRRIHEALKIAVIRKAHRSEALRYSLQGSPVEGFMTTSEADLLATTGFSIDFETGEIVDTWEEGDRR